MTQRNLFLINKNAKRIYENIIHLKIATPQIIINCGLLLEEHNYFEEAFKVKQNTVIFFINLTSAIYSYKKVYEKGISIFKWPVVYDIWLSYLTKFISRYVSELSFNF
jgi:pre-mRNA-splicing factor SYF1